MKDCPSNALNIIKVEEKKFACEYYLDRCIYCSQCVDTCPKDALAATVDFELAQTDSKKLKIFYEAQVGTKPQNVS
jgi:formate hydrogenlyase subunit 6/NADH:ubiquinone oxidoreductase subunit I